MLFPFFLRKRRFSFLSCRSSRLEVFCKIGVLRNFVKFTGKHLCQSLFFNRLAGLRPATLLKKRLWHRCFPVNFTKFLKTPFYRTPPDDCFCSAFFLPPVALLWKYCSEKKRWKKLWLEFYNYILWHIERKVNKSSSLFFNGTIRKYLIILRYKTFIIRITEFSLFINFDHIIV